MAVSHSVREDETMRAKGGVSVRGRWVGGRRSHSSPRWLACSCPCVAELGTHLQVPWLPGAACPELC